MGDTLRPSEQVPYFDFSESNITIPGGQVIQLASADPERVYLLIGTAAAGTINVSSKFPSAVAGLLVSSTISLELSQRASGPACTHSWFGFSAAGSTAFVLEIFLRRYPKGGMKELS